MKMTYRPERELLNAVRGKKLIGRGAFTKCYEMDARTVLLLTSDPIKECLALGWMPTSSRLPKLEKIDHDGIFSLYVGERFTKVASLKDALLPTEYALYKRLRKLSDSIRWPTNPYHRIYTFVAAVNASDLHHAHKALLIETAEACANFTEQLHFEISPRNVAVKNKRLVLLDCFCAVDALTKVRTGEYRV